MPRLTRQHLPSFEEALANPEKLTEKGRQFLFEVQGYRTIENMAHNTGKIDRALREKCRKLGFHPPDKAPLAINFDHRPRSLIAIKVMNWANLRGKRFEDLLALPQVRDRYNRRQLKQKLFYNVELTEADLRFFKDLLGQDWNTFMEYEYVSDIDGKIVQLMLSREDMFKKKPD